MGWIHMKAGERWITLRISQTRDIVKSLSRNHNYNVVLSFLKKNIDDNFYRWREDIIINIQNTYIFFVKFMRFIIMRFHWNFLLFLKSSLLRTPFLYKALEIFFISRITFLRVGNFQFKFVGTRSEYHFFVMYNIC